MTDPEISGDAPVRPRALHRAAIRGSSEPERSWTPVGTIDTGVLGYVDEAGSVQLDGAGWSLDWWVGAEDRWHHPSREPSVRQRSIDGAPVLETALRVPGGDVVARAYGVRAEAGSWRGPAVVVEVENRTAVPVALAFVVRPLLLDADGALHDVRSDGAAVELDGQTALLLSRAPARAVVGALDEVAPRLATGDDGPGEVALRRDHGDAEAAFVVPLTHTATARVLLPVTDQDPRGARTPSEPWTAPEAAAVAKGWSVHLGDARRIITPEPDWDEGLVWADAMLRLAGPDEVGACLDRRRSAPAGPSAAVRAAEIAEALARLGATGESAVVARGLAGVQRLGGEVRLGDRSDGTVALLHAVAGALADVHDPEAPVVEELVAPAAVAIRRLARGKGPTSDPSTVLAAVRGLRALAPSLLRVAQPEVADDALRVAARLAPPAGSSSVGATGSPVDLDDADRRSTLHEARQVRALVLAGDPTAVASVRRCWSGMAQRGRSDAVGRRVVDGADVAVGSLGFDVAELAARTNAMLDVLVVDGPEGPAVLSAFDASWAGQPVEAHGMCTSWGATSFALRWHGARPALLWEVTTDALTGTAVEAGVTEADAEAGAAAATGRVIVTAPGLDPGWRGDGREGEALLAAPAGLEPAAATAPAAPAVGVLGADQDLPGEGDSFG